MRILFDNTKVIGLFFILAYLRILIIGFFKFLDLGMFDERWSKLTKVSSDHFLFMVL
jgi:hypothetical protein